MQNKLDMAKSMMDCLLAKATPCITDCVIAELEKLGPKYRIALRLAKVLIIQSFSPLLLLYLFSEN